MRLLALLLAAVSLGAQIPAEDARNMNLPGTNSHFKIPEYRTLAEWEARKQHLRKQILSSAGLFPMPEKTPLNPRIFGRIERQGYSIEKVLLETMPGYYLGGNLYRPLGKQGKFPASRRPMGTGIMGVWRTRPVGSIPARCINLARQGYVVFAYDMVGYNDTIQTPHAFGDQREQLWAFGPLGLQLWNSIRVVDFLQSLPDVDPEKIAATGASGGGTQTFLLTAVDDRIKYSAPVNMISAIMQGGSPCENAPNLRVNAINPEFAAMMAPRPLLMVSATGDWTRNTPREEFPAVQSVYRLYGKQKMWRPSRSTPRTTTTRPAGKRCTAFLPKRILGSSDPSEYAEKTIAPRSCQTCWFCTTIHCRRRTDVRSTGRTVDPELQEAERRDDRSRRTAGSLDAVAGSGMAAEGFEPG